MCVLRLAASTAPGGADKRKRRAEGEKGGGGVGRWGVGGRGGGSEGTESMRLFYGARALTRAAGDGIKDASKVTRGRCAGGRKVTFVRCVILTFLLTRSLAVTITIFSDTYPYPCAHAHTITTTAQMALSLLSFYPLPPPPILCFIYI